MANTIKSNQRIAFVGKTGSGKTFAARILAANIPRLVVFDSKGTLRKGWNLREWNWKTERDLKRGNPVRVRIPTPLDGDFEPYFKTCYDAGDCTVYIDEMYGVLGKGRQPGQYLTALYTRGRELGIGVWACTQRPTWVPLFMLSESDWLFIFRLQLETDRKRVAEIVGTMARERVLQNHELLVYNQEWDTPVWYPKVQENAIGKAS